MVRCENIFSTKNNGQFIRGCFIFFQVCHVYEEEDTTKTAIADAHFLCLDIF